MISVSVEWNPRGKTGGRVHPGALQGLRLAAELVLERSNRLVPIEEGTLERSGRVTDNGQDEVAVSYDTPYARRQHEDMTLRHDNGRQPKFLKTAMAQSRREVAELVAAHVRKALGT